MLRRDRKVILTNKSLNKERMKDIVYELIPENTIPPLWVKVTNHNGINQRELLTTESSSTLTESLNGKNDTVDNSTIEKENDLNSSSTSFQEGDYVLELVFQEKSPEKDWLVNIILGGKAIFDC